MKSIRNKKGMSLVEMLVAIAVMSIVMLGVTQFFVHIWPMNQFAIDSAEAQLVANQSVTRLTSLFRNMRQSDAGEYALLAVGSEGVAFFADVDADGDVERLRVFREDSDLRMGTIEPAGTPVSYPLDQETLSTLATHVRNGSGGLPSEMFHYFDEGNHELTGSFSISDVRMIKIDIFIDINPSLSPEPVHFESFASIRNLSEYDRLQ